jgi:hypothetical protein
VIIEEFLVGLGLRLRVGLFVVYEIESDHNGTYVPEHHLKN